MISFGWHNVPFLTLILIVKIINSFDDLCFLYSHLEKDLHVIIA